ncbi:PQQ-binding-like beta-propeller repeat protein [Aliiglaciecola sp. M165]|uniref:outer membrane protein assembly factor BamB family protein n=1 Tax=Aliiglaciecola sp. M165 TaxID=2593649 RepID=UPI00117F4B58|nr:PQQ-binding-like beta-propeller repeat protein [Aliiglaciecola sp. M165]TRY33786.1 PQQ-binding-like beta-propeller repeat protein [Aliiglaciecola sp. M165]
MLGKTNHILTMFAFIQFISTYASASPALDERDKKLGQQAFDAYCKACHMGALPEAPKTAALELYPPSRIVESLESGVMSTQGMQLSRAEKRQIAFFLTGKRADSASVVPTMLACSSAKKDSMPKSSETIWNGWGNDHNNSRHQSNESKLTTNNVKNLSLQWAVSFPDATRVRSQPLVTKKITYIGSQSGTIYALDTDTGCLHWQFEASAEVRSALYMQHDEVGSPKALLFGDFKTNVYAIDPLSGQLRWKKHIGYHPVATITGSLIADQEKVYVPLSSMEVIPAARSDYECCTFRGSLVALDIETGEQRWTSYTTEPPTLRGKNSAGAFQYGPSGAPIWSSPTIDIKRGLIYVGTGQNYSSPATGTSDAILAIDILDGKRRWVSQVTQNDAWNGGCVRKTANCPKENGPDFDIGASPILSSDDKGREWLIVGQKSGLVYGLDPDQQGKVIWTTRVGSGGTMGGVHWGMSAAHQDVFVGVSDLPTNNPYKKGEPKPGVAKLNLSDGQIKWHYSPPNVCKKGSKYMCFNGISAAVSSSPGLVYFGGLDGMFRILAADDGKLLWEFNTKQSIWTVNGVKGFGGSIEADGPVIADGKVFVTSGYDKWGEAPGNLLLVFSLDKK